MTPKDRRALRLGVAAIVSAFLLLKGIPSAWREWTDANERLQEQHQLLLSAEARLAAMPDLVAQAAEVRRRFMALAPRLVPGATSVEAEASLEGLASMLAERSHLLVRRASALADSGTAGRLRLAGVVVELEGDWAGATSFVSALREEPVSLSVGDLSVQAKDPSSLPSAPEVLVVQVDLLGWYLPGEGK